MSLQGLAMMICPVCRNPVDRPAGYDGPICTPRRCPAWEVIGLSRNGGPLLVDVNKLRDSGRDDG